VELPELFGGGRLTPDQVLFDDVNVDRLFVSGFGATRPPMSDDSDSDTMGEEFWFNLRPNHLCEMIGTMTDHTARAQPVSATRFFPRTVPPSCHYVSRLPSPAAGRRHLTFHRPTSTLVLYLYLLLWRQGQKCRWRLPPWGQERRLR